MKQDKKYAEMSTKLLAHVVDAYTIPVTRPKSTNQEDILLIAITSVVPFALCFCFCCGRKNSAEPKEKSS
jgi:hypothetical protein